MKIVAFTLLLILTGFTASAQTEVFVSTQSGSPFSISDESDVLFWNVSIGVEHYLADKLSISFAYRKMFNLGSFDNDDNPSNTTAYYTYTYSQSITSFALDFESKYFFDSPDDGWYISSGISYQSVQTDISVLSVDNLGYVPSATPPVQVGDYNENTINIFPLTFKLGHRSSTDVIVADYFFGASYNINAGNYTYKYQDLFEYNPLKRFTFIVGAKVGFKI